MRVPRYMPRMRLLCVLLESSRVNCHPLFVVVIRKVAEKDNDTLKCPRGRVLCLQVTRMDWLKHLL